MILWFASYIYFHITESKFLISKASLIQQINPLAPWTIDNSNFSKDTNLGTSLLVTS